MEEIFHKARSNDDDIVDAVIVNSPIKRWWGGVLSDARRDGVSEYPIGGGGKRLCEAVGQ